MYPYQHHLAAMKQTLIATLIAAGIMLGTVSTALAANGELAIILQNPKGTRALNPQPEPPGVTEQQSGANRLQLNPQPEPPGVTDTAARAGSLQLNPQPEPPGVAYKKIMTSTSSVATSSAQCIQAAEKVKQKAQVIAKITFYKAIQTATVVKEKMMAYAKTLTDKDSKKAAILKAQSDFSTAQAKAQHARNAANEAAEQIYKRAIAACRVPTR